jgi:hypothetical protein
MTISPDFPWHSEYTYAAYCNLIDTVIKDPLEFARQWADMTNGDPTLLARQLRQDAIIWAETRIDPFEKKMLLGGIKKVYWWQVAARILQRAQLDEPTRKAEDGDCGAA